MLHPIFNLHVLLALTILKLLTDLTGSSDQSDAMRPYSRQCERNYVTLADI